MNKNFNDFLNSVNYKELFDSICNDISNKNYSEPAEVSLYKAIPEFNIKLLEKYHNWLNS